MNLVVTREQTCSSSAITIKMLQELTERHATLNSAGKNYH